MARELLCLLHMTQQKDHAHDESSSLGTASANAARARKSNGRREAFHRFAHTIAAATGAPTAFILAALVVIIWAAMGPMFGFSDTWQLVINTSTTIVTFLMVFLIQNTQNRDAKAIHLKLDELIRAKKGARNALVDLENCTEEELDEIEREFKRLRARAEPKQHGAPHGHRSQNDRSQNGRTPAHRT
jgi:low affinity Fe/Cu permease